ncbi:MAG TPA: lysophospholipid acyltransferase family protein [Pyrinomonadaceae bacterium]
MTTRARRRRERARHSADALCGYNPMMPEEVRVLRLGEMILRRKGRPAGRLVQAIVSVALRLFFRRIETSNASAVPTAGPLIFVLNHPNGLIDPALVFCALPRRISFLAKSTLFRMPVVGSLMRAVDALPLYRRVDEGEDTARNRRTFEACHALLARGRCIAIFPEGVSHDEPRLLPLKTGAARIALGAAAVGAAADGGEEGFGVDTETGAGLDLQIVPVGLYYTSKTTFRSEALLRFGEPFGVPLVALAEDGDPPREAVRRLSARIEEGLRAVTLNVETQGELEVAKRAEQLFSSLYEGIRIETSVAEQFHFLRRFSLGRRMPARSDEGERGRRLHERLLRYDEELRRVGLAPENLSVSSHSAWFVFRHFLLRGAALLLLSPLALIGAALHLPAYAGATVLSLLFPRHGPDVAAATAKILASILLVPLTWLVVSAVVLLLWGWRAALFALPAAALCGYVAMRTLEELYDMRGWFKAAFLLLRQRHLFLRLLLERRSLHNELKALGDDAGR